MKKESRYLFHTEVTNDEGYDNPWTIAVKELPLYGSGNTKEAAIENLIDATIELVSICSENTDFFDQVPICQFKNNVNKLIQYGNNRNAIRKLYGL